MARLSWISIDKRRAIVALGLSPPPHHLSPSSTTHFLLLRSVGALRALSSARMAWSKGRINLWADCVVRKIGDPAYLPPTSSKHRLTFCSVIFAEDAMSFLRKVAVAGIKPWVSKAGGSNLEKILRGNICSEDWFFCSLILGSIESNWSRFVEVIRMEITGTIIWTEYIFPFLEWFEQTLIRERKKILKGKFDWFKAHIPSLFNVTRKMKKSRKRVFLIDFSWWRRHVAFRLTSKFYVFSEERTRKKARRKKKNE